jgi:hypothetical protein
MGRRLVRVGHVLGRCTKKTAFWDTALYSLVEVDRRFRGAYCLQNQDMKAIFVLAAVRT